MAKLLTLSQFSTSMNSFAAKCDARFMRKGEGSNYTIKKQGAADAGYVSTYQLFSVGETTYVQATGNYVEGTTYYTDATGQTEVDTTSFVDGVTDVSSYYVAVVDETAVGAKINIPKDYLVTGVSETPLTVTSEDKATGGIFEDNDDFSVGDKYIRFTVNVKSGASDTDTFMYINLNSLVDVYTAGNGIDISVSNAVSVKIDSENTNGLSTSANGLALALATADTYGGVHPEGTYVSGVKYYSDQNLTTLVNTDSFEVGVTDVTSYYVYGISQAGTAGALSSADKYKLNSLIEATDQEVAAVIAAIWA